MESTNNYSITPTIRDAIVEIQSRIIRIQSLSLDRHSHEFEVIHQQLTQVLSAIDGR